MNIQIVDFIRLYWIQIIVVCALGYLIGSISFSILVTRFFKNQSDIRDMGSGNAGFTNVLRSVGTLPAIITMAGDFLKGIIACYIGKWIFSFLVAPGIPEFCIIQYGAYLSGLACLIGHVYPCFFEFRGGKAVLTALSVIIMTDWRVAILALSVFLIIIFTTKLVSLGSILAAISYPIFTFCITYFYDYLGSGRSVSFGYTIIVTTISLFVGMFVIYKHKKNIVKLLNGEEKKISIARNNY